MDRSDDLAVKLQSAQNMLEQEREHRKKLESKLGGGQMKDMTLLKAELEEAAASVQAERRVASDLRDELRSAQEAREGLEARMRQADKFELMYLDVVDREAKIQLLLADAEERTQVNMEAHK